MATCGKCGSTVTEGSAFCSVCGSPVSAGGGASQGAGAGLAPNVAGALAYLLGLITGILFLAIEPYKRDAFVRFHAFQSIAFNVVVIVFWTIWSNVIAAAFFAFGFLWAVISLVSTLIGLAIFAYWLFLMYKAYNSQQYRIPVLGDFAAKQAGK